MQHPNFILPSRKLYKRHSKLCSIPLKITFHSSVKKSAMPRVLVFLAGVIESRDSAKKTRHDCSWTILLMKRAWRSIGEQSGLMISETRKWSGANAEQSRQLWKFSEYSRNFPRIFWMFTDRRMSLTGNIVDSGCI